MNNTPIMIPAELDVTLAEEAKMAPVPNAPIYLKLKDRCPQRWPVARRKTVRRAKARAARVARRENRR